MDWYSTPWNSAYDPAGLLSLSVHPDGTATGGLINTTISFMELRDQRIPRALLSEVVRDTDVPDVSDTDLHASHLCNDDNALFAIGLEVPSCHWEYESATSGGPLVRVVPRPHQPLLGTLWLSTRHPTLAGPPVRTPPTLGARRPTPRHPVALHYHVAGTPTPRDIGVPPSATLLPIVAINPRKTSQSRQI